MVKQSIVQEQNKSLKLTAFVFFPWVLAVVAAVAARAAVGVVVGIAAVGVAEVESVG